MDEGVLFGLLSTFVIVAAVTVIFAALRYRAKMFELRHLERLAMIERGLVPSPDRTPLEVAALTGARAPSHAQEAKGRSLSLGIIVVGLGLAFMMLIGFAAGAPETGVGIGGAIAILGGAFIVRSILVPGEPRFAPPIGPRPPATPPPPSHRPIDG